MSVEGKKSDPDKSWQADLRASSPSMGLGLQLAGSMLFYVLLGYFLDRWLDTAPWLLIAGSVVGMFAFFLQIVRVAKRAASSGSKKD